MRNLTLSLIVILLLSYNTYSDEVIGQYGKDSLFLATMYERLSVSYSGPVGGGVEYHVKKIYWLDTLIDSIALKKEILNFDTRHPNYWKYLTIIEIHFNNSIRNHFIKKKSNGDYKYYPIIFINGKMYRLNILKDDISVTFHYHDVDKELSRIRKYNQNNSRLLSNIDNCLNFQKTFIDSSNFKYHLEYLKAFPEAANDSTYKINTQLFKERFLLDSAKAMFNIKNIEKTQLYLRDVSKLDDFLYLEAEELNFLCLIHYTQYEKVAKAILEDFDDCKYFTKEREDILIDCLNKEPKLIKQFIKYQGKINRVDTYNKLLARLITQEDHVSQTYIKFLNLNILFDIKSYISHDIEAKIAIENIIFQEIARNPKLTKEFLKCRKISEDKSNYSSILKKLIFNKEESKESHSKIIKHISAYFNRYRDPEIEKYLTLKTHNINVLKK